MSLSIKIPAKKKHLLEQIQARILLETGKKVEFQELLGIAVDITMENYNEVIERVIMKKNMNDKKINFEKLFKFWKEADVPLDTTLSDDELIYEL